MHKRYTSALIAIGLIILAGCAPTPTSRTAAPEGRVKAESRRLTSSVAVFGTVQSASASVIRAQSGGRVAKIFVERGKYINPGDTLLEVANDRFVRQREEQAGRVRSCEWALKKKELERDNKVGTERAIAEADVEIARVDLEIARRRLETATEDVSNCTVRAPFAGTVMSVDVKQGDLVTGSGDYSLGSSLFQVVGTNDYIIDVTLGEVETARLDSGCQVEVRLPAVFGEVFDAKIKAISQAAKRSDRGAIFPVAIAFSSTNPRVKLGLSAEVRFLLTTRDAAIAIPLSVVHFDDKGPWVATVTDVGRGRRYVKLGINDSAFVEVLAGLKAGEFIQE